MLAKGVAGSVEFLGEKILIKRKGLSSFLIHGLKGEKTIYIDKISSIQLRKAGLLTGRGYIQFTIAGGVEGRKGQFEAAQDENSVLFTRSQQKNFVAIKNAIEQRMASSRTASAAPSIADEIQRLAELRQRGILSEKEFEAAKQHLIAPPASRP